MTHEQDPDSILQLLTSQPNQTDLFKTLRQFQPCSSTPTSSTASVVFALVNTTIPEIWQSLRSTAESRELIQLILDSLASIAGVNALLMRLGQVQVGKQQTTVEQAHVKDVVDVLTLILEGNKFSPVSVINTCIRDGTRGKMLLNEYIALVSGSKILNVVSKTSQDLENGRDIWIADGKLYSKWLGKSFVKAITKYSDVPAVATLLGKGLSIGYPCIPVFLVANEDAVVETLIPNMISELSSLANVLSSLRRTGLLVFTKQLLHYLSVKYFNYTVVREGKQWWHADRARVGAVAHVLYDLYHHDKLSDVLVDIVKSGTNMDALPMQRACILAISKLGEHHLQTLVDSLLGTWADKASITHTPVVAQEARTQILLLSLAHTNLTRLREISTMPLYNEGLSNRLSASVDRVRFLGMIVGESTSRKLDTEERRLKFKVPETEDISAESWRSLIDIDDDFSDLKDLEGGIIEEPRETPIVEDIVPVEDFLVDDMDDMDDDLQRYPVPESDAEDSDDDPTLVSREKTPSPLYIRDLMKYLQGDNFTKVNVGLQTAPNLIRRKATFGTELSDQAHDLARILVGMQDTYEMEEFQEMRQASLIALVASASEHVMSYLIDVFFTGDLSIQQRCIILSAMGIGARELAGVEKTEMIPQQLLPPSLHRQYISPMDHLSQHLEATMIEPIRNAAVSKLSGPQILQVRHFSSISPESRRPKTSINILSKLAGRVFLFPLLGRWWIHQKDYNGHGIHFEPIILSTFIRTVGIILHVSAPSALDLRQMIKEYWDLLLSLRNSFEDPSILEAILFGELVILEIMEPRHVAEYFPKQVVETQAWTADIFERLDEGKGKLLAGGILLKTRDIVGKYERLLLGDMISFGSIAGAPLGLNLR